MPSAGLGEAQVGNDQHLDVLSEIPEQPVQGWSILTEKKGSGKGCEVCVSVYIHVLACLELLCLCVVVQHGQVNGRGTYCSHKRTFVYFASRNYLEYQGSWPSSSHLYLHQASF